MAEASNQLIDRLPAATRTALLAHCETVELNLSDVLVDAGQVLTHAYFPTASFISLVARVDTHPGLEVGMVGHEGMVGTPLVLGVGTTPVRALVQGAGPCLRLRARDLKRLLASHPKLHTELLRYVHVLMAQMAAAAGCLRFHVIGPRLARWLLMSQDRAQRDSFHVTQEFLAYMLGVRRVGITVAAGDLQRRGLIRYHRGALRVLDRPGLEAAACSCYAADGRAYLAGLGLATA